MKIDLLDKKLKSVKDDAFFYALFSTKPLQYKVNKEWLDKIQQALPVIAIHTNSGISGVIFKEGDKYKMLRFGNIDSSLNEGIRDLLSETSTMNTVFEDDNSPRKTKEIYLVERCQAPQTKEYYYEIIPLHIDDKADLNEKTVSTEGALLNYPVIKEYEPFRDRCMIYRTKLFLDREMAEQFVSDANELML